MENPDTFDFANNDANGFFKQYDGNLILDEVQRVPKLFSYLQMKADETKSMGKYILSGSQNFHLMQNITQSLAGRVALFKLFPFDFSEMKTAKLLSKNYTDAMIKGFYPAVYDREIAPENFYKNYIQTYLEKDISQLVKVKNMRQFRNFLALCAARTGQLLNLNSVANECGISQPTAKAWLSVLESSYVVFLLQPYHENFSKRIVKTPKLYFYDTGLVCHLLKLDSGSLLTNHDFKGALFENMMIAEMIKQNEHNYLNYDFWFWRDSAGHETDVIMRKKNQVLHTLEIKATQTVTSKFFSGLNYFENTAKGKKITKTLIYAGNETQKRTKLKVLAWDNPEGLLG